MRRVESHHLFFGHGELGGRREDVLRWDSRGHRTLCADDILMNAVCVGHIVSVCWAYIVNGLNGYVASQQPRARAQAPCWRLHLSE